MDLSNPLKSIHDVKCGDYVIHEADKKAVFMLLQIVGVMGNNFKVQYVFTKVGIQEPFLVSPTSLYKASDIFKSFNCYTRHNEKIFNIPFEHIEKILRDY